VVLRAALAQLEETDRRILVLRFFEALTQAQIADRLGTNQVQISRRLRTIFHRLRLILDTDRDTDDDLSAR
jgi:RNA polymerase sigma-B factor